MAPTGDVRDARSVDAAIETVVAALGGLDVLVNNDGVGAQGTVAENPDDEWIRVLDLNVVGIARVSRAALPRLHCPGVAGGASALRRSSHPSIVNTSSVLADVGVPNRALYTATKGAVKTLTLAMAADHLTDAFGSTALHRAPLHTVGGAAARRASSDAGAARKALEARQPLGRLVSAAEVGCCDRLPRRPLAGSTTGTSLPVDGGMGTLRPPT